MNRLSVLENVLIGALGSTPFWRTCFSYFTREQKQRALQALTRVGMVHFAISAFPPSPADSSSVWRLPVR